MKKEYMKPTMRVVELQHHAQILAGSAYDSVSTPLGVYDEGDDVITDQNGIW